MKELLLEKLKTDFNENKFQTVSLPLEIITRVNIYFEKYYDDELELELEDLLEDFLNYYPSTEYELKEYFNPKF